MARPLRIQFPGAFYHVIARGNNKNPIFNSDRDRVLFLDVLSDAMARYAWSCHAYCLMNNHYHLLVETHDATLSQGMRHLNGVYTQRFNRRNNRVGHLFQGRYKAFVVQNDDYLLEVARYIVLNPVRAQLVEHPKDWVWSSFLSTQGHRPLLHGHTRDRVLGYFSAHRSSEKAYEMHILEAIHTGYQQNLKEFGMVSGEGEFAHNAYELATDSEKIREHTVEERLANRPTLEEFFLPHILADKAKRNHVIRLAHQRAGYTQKEIADFLDLHYTWISKIITEKL